MYETLITNERLVNAKTKNMTPWRFSSDYFIPQPSGIRLFALNFIKLCLKRETISNLLMEEYLVFFLKNQHFFQLH